jgi:hypothetical protein
MFIKGTNAFLPKLFVVIEELLNWMSFREAVHGCSWEMEWLWDFDSMSFLKTILCVVSYFRVVIVLTLPVCLKTILSEQFLFQSNQLHWLGPGNGLAAFTNYYLQSYAS